MDLLMTLLMLMLGPLLKLGPFDNDMAFSFAKGYPGDCTPRLGA